MLPSLHVPEIPRAVVPASPGGGRASPSARTAGLGTDPSGVTPSRHATARHAHRDLLEGMVQEVWRHYAHELRAGSPD